MSAQGTQDSTQDHRCPEPTLDPRIPVCRRCGCATFAVDQLCVACSEDEAVSAETERRPIGYSQPPAHSPRIADLQRELHALRTYMASAASLCPGIQGGRELASALRSAIPHLEPKMPLLCSVLAESADALEEHAA